MSTAVKVEHFVKSYGGNTVIKDISFSVAHGEIFGFLGTNGAGKTTTLECIEGLRSYDSGSITVSGKTGVQLQSSTLPEDMKAAEAVRLFSLWNKSGADSTQTLSMDFEDIKNKRYKSMSTGQKRRLHLILALIGDPDIIFLDEPTAGLDVESRILLHEEIKKLRQRGKTIILASHDMAEVEALCDRLLILKDGKAAFTGAPEELKSRTQKTYRIIVKASAPLSNAEFTASTYTGREQGSLLFEAANIADALYELIGNAKKNGIEISDIKIDHASMEDGFMDIAKGEAL